MPIIDRLFEPDGPQLLAGEPAKALLKGNGILRVEQANWAVVAPDGAVCPAMASVWNAVEAFIERARGRGSVPLADLVQTLRRPPFGLPVRCMPVLFAAVAREPAMLGNLILDHQRTRTIKERVGKLTGEAVEDAFTDPEAYALVYLEWSDQQRVFLHGVADALGIELPQDGDIATTIATVKDGVARWWTGLPRHAQLLSRSSIPTRFRLRSMNSI